MLTPSPVWYKNKNSCNGLLGSRVLMFTWLFDNKRSFSYFDVPFRSRLFAACNHQSLSLSSLEESSIVFGICTEDLRGKILYLCSFAHIFGACFPGRSNCCSRTAWTLKGRFWHVRSDCQVEREPDEFGFRSHARRLLLIMFGLDVGQHEWASMTLQGKPLDLGAQICMAAETGWSLYLGLFCKTLQQMIFWL